MKLKTKIILLCLVSLIGYSAVTVFQFNASQTGQRQEIRVGFALNEKVLAGSVSQVFYNLYHNAQAFVKNDAFKTKQPEKISFVLNELVNLYQIYDVMIFVDANGNFVASNDLSPDGKKLNIAELKAQNFKEAQWFKDASQNKFTEDMNKKIFGSLVGNFQIDPVVKGVYGEDRLGQHFTTIVDDGFGGVIGVLTTYAGVRWIDQEISALEKSLEQTGKKGVELRFMDKTGAVVSSNTAALTSDGLLGRSLRERTLENLWFKRNPDLEPRLKNMTADTFGGNEALWAYGAIKNDKFIDDLGWQVLMNVASDSAFSGINAAANLFYISLVVALLVTVGVAVWIGNGLSQQIKAIAETVFKDSNSVYGASEDLAVSSTQLSEASTQQASSLQETAASLDEINAMVKRNTESCLRSKDMSQECKVTAVSGQDAIRRMSQAMEQIKEQNAQIVKEMENNNQEIRSVIKVIAEIEQKTRVINDIVFQTKLLSFNASVEAARAGEHGKGFSVVAQEVGNLAEMSGKSAKEISDLLNASLSNVEQIINETTTKVERLINAGKSRIDEGIRIVQENESSLKKIVENVTAVNGMVEGIASASQEQTQGLQEISRAMSQLDAVTQSNTEISLKTSEATQKLNIQVGSLKNAADSLMGIVDGNDKAAQGRAKGSALAARGSHGAPAKAHKDAHVIPFEAKKSQKPSLGQLGVSVEKKAVGSSAVPDANDDRFEEV